MLYESGGINWQPWYEVFYDHKAGKLTRFACYVDITNQSGADIRDAVLQLIAGTNQSDAANRARPRGAARAASLGGAEAAFDAAPAMAAFSMESAQVETVGEAKMYRIPDTVNLENGVPNSMALVFCTDVPVDHEYHAHQGYFAHLDSDNEDDLPKLPVVVKLRLKNDAEHNIGAALPPAAARIFEPDSAGEMQKTDSSAVTGHVAVGEGFALDLRNPSRDIKHTRRMVDYYHDPEPEEESIEDDGGEDETEVEQPIMRPLGAEMTGGPHIGTPSDPRRRQVPEAVIEGAGKKRDKKKAKPAPRFAEEEREVVVYNFKGEEVTVVVHESVPHNATFLHNTHQFAAFSQGSGTIKVTVPAKGEAEAHGSATIRYRIRYQIN